MPHKHKTEIRVATERFHVPEANILDLRKAAEDDGESKEQRTSFLTRLFRRGKVVTAEDEALVTPRDGEQQTPVNPIEEYFIFENDEDEDEPEVREEESARVVLEEVEEPLDEPVRERPNALEKEEVEEEASQFSGSSTTPRSSFALRMPRLHIPRVAFPTFPKLRVSSFSMPRTFKPVLGFAVMCLLLVLPVYAFGFYAKARGVQGRVLGASESAVLDLKQASEFAREQNFASLSEELGSAVENFSRAQTELADVSRLLKLIPVKGDEVESAQELLIAGEELALAGQNISQALAPFADANSAGEQNAGAVLLSMNEQLQPAIRHLEKASSALLAVNPSVVPAESRPRFTSIQSDVPALLREARELVDMVSLLAAILGQESKQRVLFLFQNNEEMRATGGFWGSYGVMEIDEGKIKTVDVGQGGTYDLDGWLEEKVVPPAPLLLVAGVWGLRDANWFPDFPTSAQKAIWFYEHGTNRGSVDGVVAFTPEVVKAFLEITGPLAIPESGVTVSADTLVDVIEREKEKSLQESYMAPKDILRELTPILLEKVFASSSEEIPAILEVFDAAVREKHLLFYFQNAAIESRILERGWGGEVKQSRYDFLSVIHSNITGGKTDGMIDESVTLDVNVQPDGSVVNTLEVTRTHRGAADDPVRGVKNIEYVRVYVPEGSTLLSADGFEDLDPRLFLYPDADAKPDEDLERVQGRVTVDEASGMRVNTEFGKTVFGNWFGVEPGESRTFRLSYRLPFTVELEGLLTKNASYSLLAEKQSGSRGSALHVRFHLPQAARVIWRYPEDESVSRDNSTIQFDTLLDTDRYFGLVMQE